MPVPVGVAGPVVFFVVGVAFFAAVLIGGADVAQAVILFIGDDGAVPLCQGGGVFCVVVGVGHPALVGEALSGDPAVFIIFIAQAHDAPGVFDHAESSVFRVAVGGGVPHGVCHFVQDAVHGKIRDGPAGVVGEGAQEAIFVVGEVQICGGLWGRRCTVFCPCWCAVFRRLCRVHGSTG